jgi:hypothetical protein
MGMYANHGVEYHVVLRDGKTIVIASTKNTDDRLQQSHFFKVREAEWLSVETMYRNGSFVNRIVDHDLDIQLTDQERVFWIII